MNQWCSHEKIGIVHCGLGSKHFDDKSQFETEVANWGNSKPAAKVLDSVLARAL